MYQTTVYPISIVHNMLTAIESSPVAMAQFVVVNTHIDPVTSTAMAYVQCTSRSMLDALLDHKEGRYEDIHPMVLRMRFGVLHITLDVDTALEMHSALDVSHVMDTLTDDDVSRLHAGRMVVTFSALTKDWVRSIKERIDPPVRA